MIKLVVSDMDGTLLNSRKEMPSDTFEVIEKLYEANVLFAAASGRQYFNLVKNFEPVKDKMLFISENGAYTMLHDEVLDIELIDKAKVKELLKIAESIDEVYPVLCGKKGAYINSDEPRVIEQVLPYYSIYHVVEDLNMVEDDIFKIAFLDFKGSEKNVYPYYQKYENELQICVSAKEWMDIMVKGVNKGSALREVLKRLNLERSEVMVFGDFMNDYEMMQEADYSYAMANAHPKLKAVCNYECESNEEAGVIKTIRQVFGI